MADPKTILEYATKRSASAGQSMADAQQQLATAQTQLAQVNTEREGALAKLTKLEAQAVEIRQKLSVVATPADGAALLDALEQTTVRIRATQAALVNIQENFSVIQARVTRAQTDVAAVTAEQQAASAALAQATDENTRLEALATALGDPPLADINTEAGKALDDANPVEGLPFKNAKLRIEADIPTKLNERAVARRTQAKAHVAQEQKNLSDAEDATLKEGDTHGGLDGVAAKAWATFKRAETAATNFLNNSQAYFDQAKAALLAAGDPDQSPLTPEQKARINDAALLADREAAAAAEANLDTTVAKDVFDKQKLLDEAILKAKADPSATNEQDVADAQLALTNAQNAYNTAIQNWREKETLLGAAFDLVEQKQTALAVAIQHAVDTGSDPDTDPDVALAKGQLTTAQNDLKSAETNYKASENGTLDLWESAVPDGTWRLFDKYERAVDVLNGLKNSNPATLKTNLKNTEEAYVTAQLAADRSRGILAQLAAEQAQRAARGDGASKTADARLFSALRGDE